MNYKIIYHKDVKKDVTQAKDWYKSQQIGLEKRFASEVSKTLKFLIKNPLLFQVKYKMVRTAFTEIFPYGVHYHLDDRTKTIIILGVFHTSISPRKWLKRQ